ncbi:MAG TPA: chromate resistance protein ChrB domain-containing protein [Rhizomicrobium sp.]|nr:chromate resistance protein ChrB domain-containing protein [Rhizomicrobium sp.]
MQTKERRSWLLFAHQLPPKSGYLRVKLWRQLREIGAIPLKNALYILPTSHAALDDFRRVLLMLERDGGDGAVCEASFVEGVADKDLEAQFRSARAADYQRLARHLRTLAGKHKNRLPDLRAKLDRSRQQLSEIVKRDFFQAAGRSEVENLLSQLEHSPITRTTPGSHDAPDLKSLVGKSWVTRANVHVDRIACAWLIRRFIDPQAKFLFVYNRRRKKLPGQLGFDMTGAEFTHEGDKCSFEVFVERIGSADSALKAIAEIIHDLDLKDGKFGRPETSGIGHLIEGICATQKSDMDRVARGAALFDDSYERFRRGNG